MTGNGLTVGEDLEDLIKQKEERGETVVLASINGKATH